MGKTYSRKKHFAPKTIFAFYLFFVMSILIIGRVIKLGELKSDASTPNPIQIENSKPGTPNWQITNPSTNGEIQGYALYDSVNKGTPLPIAVSVNVPNGKYSMDLYRLGYYGGVGARSVQTTLTGYNGLAQGYYINTNPPASGATNCPTCSNPAAIKDTNGTYMDMVSANWKTTNIFSTANLQTGVYYIKLTETTTGKQWGIPFVLRDDFNSTHADLVMEYPMNNEQAYNLWGGSDLYSDYTNTKPGWTYWAFEVSFDRPFLDGNGSAHLLNWIYQLVRYTEQQGYNVAYTTNSAIAQGNTILTNYKGLIVDGHDEYVDYEERQKIESAIANGVSLAMFGADDMYWQVRPDPINNPLNPYRNIINYKDAAAPPYLDPYNTPGNPNQYLATTQWRNPPLNNPEDKIFKSMFGLNGTEGSGGSSLQNFVVTNTSHWAFTNTNLKDGDTIKGLKGSADPILGIEVDISYNDGSIGPNDKVTVIGSSPFTDSVGGKWTATATLDELQNGKNNIVFNAGTMYWSNGLVDSNYQNPSNIVSSPQLITITNNILNRIVTGQIPTPQPSPTPTNTPTPISQFATVGGKLTNTQSGAGIANSQLVLYDISLAKLIYVNTDINGNWSNNSLIRPDDFYSVRPDVYYGESYCPKGYTCSQTSFPTSPNPWSYENQQAGKNDCNTQCNFTFTPAVFIPTPHRKH